VSNNREEEIRRRAYELWERGGRIGNAEDHWFQAEREIKRSSSVDLGVNPALGGIRKHTGKCFCGSVEVVATGDPLTTPLLIQQRGGSIMTIYNHIANPGQTSEGLGVHGVDLSFSDSAAPGAIYNPLFFGHQFETLTGSAVATLNGRGLRPGDLRVTANGIEITLLPVAR